MVINKNVAFNFRVGALPHSTLPPRTMPLRSVPFSPGAMPARRSPSAALPSLHLRLPADRLSPSPSLRPHPPDDLDRPASDMGPPLFGRVHFTRPSSHLASGIWTRGTYIVKSLYISIFSKYCSAWQPSWVAQSTRKSACSARRLAARPVHFAFFLYATLRKSIFPFR